MRYAVLSDIHGNLEALEAVLADAAPRTDALLCLGDLVGYGADPLACVEIVAARAYAITCGNHEYGVTGLLDLDWFNPHARAAAEWTRERLDDDHRTYLAGLPLVDVLPADFSYRNLDLLLDQVKKPTQRLARMLEPLAAQYDRVIIDCPPSLSLASESVFRAVFQRLKARGLVTDLVDLPDGMFHEGAGDAIWDAERGTVAIRRVVYDVKAAAGKIRQGGLPRFLADRLAWGS